MNLTQPPHQLDFIRSDQFQPKRIIIVDDNETYRLTLRLAAQEADTILFETNNLTDAVSGLPGVIDELDVAVLDCNILEAPSSRYIIRDGGPQIAVAISRLNPNVGIFSISDQWEGQWDNPLYDSSRPHHYDPYYDENGWTKTRGPDVYATWINHNVEELAQLIGHFSPRDRDEWKLAMLEYTQRRFKER